jgi:hypothetical protein
MGRKFMVNDSVYSKCGTHGDITSIEGGLIFIGEDIFFSNELTLLKYKGQFAPWQPVEDGLTTKAIKQMMEQQK